MSAWTKGPWHWVNSQTDKPFDFDSAWDGDGRPSLRTVAEQEGRCGMLPDWILDAEPLQYGNDAANAHLIAAAPDLAEACEALMELAYREGWIHVAIENARAALAKARGES